MSSDKNCYSLYPTTYWDSVDCCYETEVEPHAYSIDRGDLFAACCGANFDAESTGDFKNNYEAGIMICARNIKDLAVPEAEVAHIETKNGPLTIVTYTSWSEYDPSDDEDNW